MQGCGGKRKKGPFKPPQSASAAACCPPSLHRSQPPSQPPTTTVLLLQRSQQVANGLPKDWSRLHHQNQGKNHSFVCISAGKDVSFFFFSCLPEMFNDGGGSFLWFSMIPSLVSLETQIHYSCFSFPSVLVCSFMFYFVVMVTGSCIY